MITFPPLTIREIFLIGISLLLKGNSTIGFMTISEDNQPYKPFDEIPQIKEHIEHFFHLLSMYHFMIKRHITDWLVSSCEENPEEVHVTETSRGIILFLIIFILDNE